MSIETIETINRYSYFHIETKEGNTYRRSSDSCNWEELLGDSWESIYLGEEELEIMFQEWVLRQKEKKS